MHKFIVLTNNTKFISFEWTNKPRTSTSMNHVATAKTPVHYISFGFNSIEEDYILTPNITTIYQMENIFIAIYGENYRSIKTQIQTIAVVMCVM